MSAPEPKPKYVRARRNFGLTRRNCGFLLELTTDNVCARTRNARNLRKRNAEISAITQSIQQETVGVGIAMHYPLRGSDTLQTRVRIHLASSSQRILPRPQIKMTRATPCRRRGASRTRQSRQLSRAMNLRTGTSQSVYTSCIEQVCLPPARTTSASPSTSYFSNFASIVLTNSKNYPRRTEITLARRPARVYIPSQKLKRRLTICHTSLLTPFVPLCSRNSNHHAVCCAPQPSSSITPAPADPSTMCSSPSSSCVGGAAT